MKPLRTLFYGMSHEHAPGKLETLKKLADYFEIVAIVDDRPRNAPTYHTDPIVTDGMKIVSEAEAWDIDDIDVAFVEVANRHLMEIAARFAERGIPMHCDKPCGESMEPYRTIVEICRSKSIPFQIGYMFRVNPAVQFCWRAVRDGLLGDISFIEADMNHCYGDNGYQHYVGTFKGGILYNLGCHMIDMIEPMTTGMPHSVHSVIGTAVGDAPDCLNRTVAMLDYPTMNILIRSCSRAGSGNLGRRLRIDGSNGTIDLCPIERFDGKPLTLNMTLLKPIGAYHAGVNTLDFGIVTDRYAEQLMELAQIIRGAIPFDLAQYDHDLKVHELTLMCCAHGCHTSGS